MDNTFNIDEDMRQFILGNMNSPTPSLVNSLEEIPRPPIFEPEEQRSFVQRVKNLVVRKLTDYGYLARDIGISVRRSAYLTIDAVLNAIRPAFTGSLDFLIGVIRRVLHESIRYLWSFAQNNMQTYRSLICTSVGICIASIAFVLPTGSIGPIARYLMVGMSLLVAYSQDYVAAGIGAFIVYFITKTSPSTLVNVTIENTARPQGFKEDTKSLVLDLATVSVLLTAGFTGMSVPTDSKSWDDMLKRHSLLHRAFNAWNFAAEKLSEVIDRITHYVFKYILGREYSSFNHIVEVEDLYEQVLKLSHLDSRMNIGRDPALALKIESMYIQYLNLCRVYSNNRFVMTRLSRLGGPLTDYYRQVADKNPKAHVMRKEPVCMALYGPTGIGKSYLMSRMQQDLLKITGKFDETLPLEGMIYSRAIEQEFWDGYAGQPIVVYDDFGQKVDSAVSPNLEFFEIIRAINIFPYQLHCAALAEKANNPFMSEFVLLTTNLHNFKPVSIISQDAFLRRIHLNVRISLIDQVKGGLNGACLDLEKLVNYQSENNLEEHDMSHLRFNVDNETLTYEQLIVRASLQYKKHHESYLNRQKSNLTTSPMKLPSGAFSVLDRWVESGNEEQPQTSTSATPQLINDITEPETPPDFLEEHRFPRFVDANIQELNRVVRGWLNMRSGRAHQFWGDFIELLRHFRTTYGPVLKAIGTMVFCFSMVGIVTKFVSGVWTTEYRDKGLVLTSLTRMRESFIVSQLKDHVPTILVPLAGHMSVTFNYAALCEFFYHYVVHPLFEKTCEMCKSHDALLKPIEPSAFVLDPQQLIKEYDEMKSDIDACLQSPNSTPVVKKVILEAESDLESANRNQIKNQVQVESPTRVQLTKRVQVEAPKTDMHQLQLNFALSESGRSCDDTKKKRTTVEGIRCEQLENIKAIFRRNLWLLKFKDDETEHEIGFVTVIKGRKALINFHYIQSLTKHNSEAKGQSFAKFTQANMKDGHSYTLKDLITSAKPVYRGQHQTEFYIINMPSTINIGRDLTHHMIQPSDAGKLSKGLPLQVSTMRKDEKGVWTPMTVAGPLERIHIVEVADVLDSSLSHKYLESVYYGIPTKGGDCGNPVFIDSDQFAKKLLGFHFAGQVGKGIASVITFKDIQEYVSDEMSLGDPQSINLVADVTSFPLTNSSFYVQGKSVHKISHPCKTSVQPSLIHGLFGEPEMRPALLAPPLKEGGPMLKAIAKNAANVVQLSNIDRLADIKSDYFKHNIAPYTVMEVERQIFDFETACKGIEGNMYIPPIKRGKSPGYPYMAQGGKGKTIWFGKDEWDFSSSECHKLKEEVAILLSRAAKGQVPEAIFVATLKDEKRLNAKVDAGKTRVFSACPQHFLIAFRQYFAGFIAFMARNRISNESAIGTNVHGYDWKEIVRNLKVWDKQNMIAGDFADFDGTFQPQMFTAVVDIINNFYNDSSKNQAIRRSLWAALVNPLHLMGDWIFTFSHGQPSGSPITALSNSMYLSLCFRFVLYDILKEHNMQFHNHAKLITYGDDSILSISPVLATYLTPKLLAQLFKTQLGMNYTTAHKGEFTDEDGYEAIEQVSFLKREFAFDSELNHWFAPLDLVSIREMCNWIKKSSSEHQATVDNCNDAMKELCHHPAEVFEDYRQKIGSACCEHGIFVDVPDRNLVRFLMSKGQIDYISLDRPFV